MVVSIFLFDDFETIGGLMPVQIFGQMREHFYVRLLSKHGGLVTSAQGVKVWTEPLNPIEIEDIFILPGGKGAKRLFQLDPEIPKLLKKSVENADYCASIAEGTGLLTQAGLLYHRTAADFGYDVNWKQMFTTGVNFVKGIRWAADGKFYTCSGAMQSADMLLGLLSDCMDVEDAQKAAERMGMAWDCSEEGVLR